MARTIAEVVTDKVEPYGIPRKLKCGPCQVFDHENCEGDDCYCDCGNNRTPD